MKRPTIISLGEVLWDLFPEGERFGGAPANFACHAAILGGDVSIVSAVGRDERGREAITILQGHGINVGLTQIIPEAPTGTVGVTLDSARKPTFTIHEGSAWDHIAWTTELESRIANSDAVYFGTLGQRSEVSRATIHRAIESAGAAAIPCVLDINLRPPFFDTAIIRESVRAHSVLKLSDDELATVCAAFEMDHTTHPEDLLRHLLQVGHLDLVVLTRGARGALLISPDEVVDQPGFPTTVCDTVGAGDSFTAVLVLGLLRGQSHDMTLRRACETAAAVCSQSGAVPLPADRQSPTRP